MKFRSFFGVGFKHDLIVKKNRIRSDNIILIKLFNLDNLAILFLDLNVNLSFYDKDDRITVITA
jgi:hypothetical protein